MINKKRPELVRSGSGRCNRQNKIRQAEIRPASITSAHRAAAPYCTARRLLIGRRYEDPGRHWAAMAVNDVDTPAIVRRGATLIVRQHHDLGAEADALIEIDHVRILQSDAPARNVLADRRRVVGAVD